MCKKSCKRLISLILCTILVFSLVLSACNIQSSSGNKDTNSSPDGNASSDKPRTAERVKLTMFSTDAGIKVPTEANTSDNPFINIAKDYANVDIAYEIVPWIDMQTKTNLLLASGKYPDIVHTAYNENVGEVENRGGFINLLPYFEKSAVVQKFIDKDAYTKLCKNSKTGEYHYIPMSSIEYPDGVNFVMRYDLVEKYNEGKVPETIDGWVQLARKVKEGNPNATPFSAWCPGTLIFAYGYQWWRAYGVNPNLGTRRLDDGTYVFHVTLPEYKEALNFHKQLYKEGLLSQTFATNRDYAQFSNDYDNNDVLVIADSCQQSDGWLSSNVLNPNVKWVMAPLLKEYPVDEKYAMSENLKSSKFDTGHRVHISKSCANPDAAWKFIEGLCTAELYEKIFWGDEGETYIVKDNKRHIIPATFNDPNRTYSLVYAMIMGYGSGLDARRTALRDKMNPDLIDMNIANIKNVASKAIPNENLVLNDLLSDDVTSKWDEARGIVTSLAVKYIMDKITVEEYDQGIRDFLSKYQYMMDEYTKAYKARYIDKVK